ncbi:Putative ketoacyl reductase [Symmachiella dynata]|uniref:SDR family NAD(P)-dependent oxidoreductase n=1 Tax=Symmachiella dynata TaxID=2527995 RepID=UPI0011886AB2|nr:SDR family NAD(P)-dependent oxidoreductase [Symmachiella dynata]QDT46591.1 Putative ketoacyl reductase [Symmachiella dynata]
MTGKLDGRIALITGAGRGIGRAIALDYAAQGAHVAAAARSQDQLDSLVKEITAAGGTATAFSADLFNRSAAAELVAEVKAKMGPVQILVNNAGIGSSAKPAPVAEFDDDFWDSTLQLNLTAPFLLCKAVLPDMVAAGWGRIITVASINSRIPSVHAAAYNASKHGVMGLARTVAVEYARAGITSNCICPGPVKTVMNNARVEYDAQRKGVDHDEYEAGLTPIGGRLVPEDISPLAVYLASDDAKMVTGQSYNVDGGIVMS